MAASPKPCAFLPHVTSRFCFPVPALPAAPAVLVPRLLPGDETRSYWGSSSGCWASTPPPREPWPDCSPTVGRPDVSLSKSIISVPLFSPAEHHRFPPAYLFSEALRTKSVAWFNPEPTPGHCRPFSEEAGPQAHHHFEAKEKLKCVKIITAIHIFNDAPGCLCAENTQLTLPEMQSSQQKCKIIYISKENSQFRKANWWYFIISLIYFIHSIITHCPRKISHALHVIAIVQDSIT